MPVALVRDLEALAKLHQCDPVYLAGDLLAAALEDVVNALPQDLRQKIRHIKAEQAHAEIESHREALSWDTGGT